MQEEWKPVSGYEGIYEVSNLGRVKRLSREIKYSDGRRQVIPEMMMKEDTSSYFVVLYKDGKYRNRIVRSLVAEAFMNAPYGTDITHLDGDAGNSCLSNLMLTSDFRRSDPDWRDIPGWEGAYQASRYGQIRSLDRYVVCRGGCRFCKGVVRDLEESSDGYYQIALYDAKIGNVTKNAHVFVARAWIPNPENKPTVNHIDGNKHNNCIENLEWATYTEQQAHAVRTGLRKHHYWDSKIHGPVGGDWNEKQRVRVRCIETGVEYDSFSAAGAALGTGASEVKRSADEHKVCKGFHFVRANELDYPVGVASLPGEVWKDIPGYEGRYVMSNLKRVKSVPRMCRSARGSRSVPEQLISLKYGLHLFSSDGESTTLDVDKIHSQLF